MVFYYRGVISGLWDYENRLSKIPISCRTHSWDLEINSIFNEPNITAGLSLQHTLSGFFFYHRDNIYHRIMPRRVPDFPDSFHSWNFLSSIGSGITFSFLFFFLYLSIISWGTTIKRNAEKSEPKIKSTVDPYVVEWARERFLYFYMALSSTQPDLSLMDYK